MNIDQMGVGGSFAIKETEPVHEDYVIESFHKGNWAVVGVRLDRQSAIDGARTHRDRLATALENARIRSNLKRPECLHLYLYRGDQRLERIFF